MQTAPQPPHTDAAAPGDAAPGAGAPPPHVLIVEDDPDTAAAVAAEASALGCTHAVAPTLAEGLAAAPGATVIVLDRMLPAGDGTADDASPADGIAAIPRLRAAGATGMILVLSALGRAAQRVEGLDKGADDYLAKPFDPPELRARLRALLRRATVQVSDNDLMVFGDLEIRLRARTVHIGRRHVPVSPKEFALITFLARNAGQVVTRSQLLEQVWRLHFDPGTNVVDVHVGRLRRKLEDIAGRPLIQTARGEGYVFAPRPPAQD